MRSRFISANVWRLFSFSLALVCLGSVANSVSAHSEDNDVVVQTNLPGTVDTIAFTPAGDLIATTGSGNCVLIWAIPSGKLLKRIEASSSPIAFSPDGGTLAVRQSRNIVLFALRSGVRIGSYQGATEPTGVEFADNSKTMAVSYFRDRIAIWDLVSGRKLKEISGSSPFALSMDGGRLAAVTKSGISIWNLKTGNALGKVDQFRCSALSRDARLAVCAQDDLSIIYDLRTHLRLVQLEKIDSRSRHAFVLTPDGRFVVRQLDNRVGIWETKSGKHVRDLIPSAEMAEATFVGVANNRVALSSKNGIQITDIREGTQVTNLKVEEENTTGVTFVGNETIVHVDPIAGIAKWSLQSGARLPLPPINNVPRWMFSAAITDKIAAVVAADDVLVWNSNGADTFRSLNIKNTISLKLSIVPDSNLIVFGSGERLVLGDAVTDKPLRIWNSEAAVLEGFTVDPNGKYVASAGFKQGSVKLWDLGTGDEVVGVTQLPADAQVLAFNRRGTKLAGEFSTERMGEQIIIWSVPDLSRMASFPAGDEGVRAIAFDWEAGRLALLTFDGFLKMFDLPSGKLRKTLTSADCDTLAINGSANLLACGGRYQNFVRLWRLKDAEVVGNLYSIGTEDWVVESPGGYYDSSQRAMDLVGWKVGMQVVSSDKLRQNRRVPGLLARAVEK